MLKKLSVFTALMFTLLLIPIQAFAAGGGEAAAAHPEVSGPFYTALAILSFATIIFMTYLTIKDNG